MADPDSPSSSGLRLRIETQHLHDRPLEQSNHTIFTTPSSKRPPDIRLSTSAVLPVPVGITAASSARRPIRKITSNAPNEIRKLLYQLLDQLHQRGRPPLITDSLKDSAPRGTDGRLVAAVGTVVGAIRFQRSIREGQTRRVDVEDDADLDNDSNQEFTTDHTFALLNQLKDVFSVSVAQGWDLLAEGSSNEPRPRRSIGKGPSSPFKLRRNSFQNKQGSRSPSPVKQETDPSVGTLSKCIHLLASIIAEDCRYQTSSPRPSRPPNALQAVTLDFAQFLMYANRDEPKVLSQIAFALLPAFQTFRAEMIARLLAFFNEIIIGSTLQTLREIRGDLTSSRESHEDSSHGDGLPPSISIKVDSADEDPFTPQLSLTWTPWTSKAPMVRPGIPSAHDPFVPVTVYHLSSLLSPLLATVLEHVPIATAPPAVRFQFQRMVDLMMEVKPDTYSEVLAVVAYHTNLVRRSALSLLTSAWPRAVGHVFETSPIPVLAPFELSPHAEEANSGSQHKRNLYSHEFVPWHFVPLPGSEVFEGSSRTVCRACAKQINGFGLMCPLCMTASHFDCYDYPEGSFLSQYSMAKESRIQKVAVYRFCSILPPRIGPNSRVSHINGHSFSLVNLFTLALCFVCRKPLWGCTMQAYKCDSCKQFAHESCLSTPAKALSPCRSTIIDSSTITIEWSAMRRSFVDASRDILVSPEDISRKSYEDISVIYSQLWTQLKILENGIALGSIVFTGTSQKFELHYVLELCEAHLSTGTLEISPTVSEYLEANRLSSTGHLVFYDWTFLAYVTTLVKCPVDAPDLSQAETSFDYLQVDEASFPHNPSVQEEALSFEIMSVAHMRDVLGYELNMRTDATARLLLSHLHQLGFIERLDTAPYLLGKSEAPNTVYCRSPLPFGLDLSSEVETLFSAVEACLSDIDLSVNEIGFLLLSRRLWPNGLSTDYASRRLSRSILSWILGEDDSFATILRDYVSRSLPVPGLRSTASAQPWPLPPNTRLAAANSTGSGGDYASCRRSLLYKYALPWMFALHEQDSQAYGRLLYEICCDLAMSSATWIERSHGSSSAKSESVISADESLRCIVKAAHASVTFTAFDDILSHWLHATLSSDICDERLPSLQRAFAKEADSSSRRSVSVLLANDTTNTVVVEPWTTIKRLASEGKEGLRRCITWLGLMARSGVDVPNAIYVQLASAIELAQLSLRDCDRFMEAMLHTTYLKSLGRQELQAAIVTQQTRLLPELTKSLQSRRGGVEPISYVRRCLATCLLLYGCERDSMASMEMLDKSVESHSRRNASSRGAPMRNPLRIDPRLVPVLETYIESGSEELACCVARFLKSCTSDAPLLDDLEEWLRANGDLLCRCAWQFYSIQRSEMFSVRPTFLLRILVAEPSRFKMLLQAALEPSVEWQSRLHSLSKLFRIILDSTSPEFDDEHQQWRSYLFDVFFFYFSAVWVDESEEIRLAVDTWSQSLLPSQLDAITGFWSEMLLKAPVDERIKMISFMTQICPRFPNWQPASWQVIRILLEDSGFQAMLGLASNIPPGNTDVELHASIVLLALRMLPSKSVVDIGVCQMVKDALTRMIGFQEISPPLLRGLEVVPAYALPCIGELVNLLDAYRPLNLSPAAMGRVQSEGDIDLIALVGSFFVDVLLALVVEVKSLLSFPVSSAKQILEGMIIIVYKHDMDSKALSHLQSNLRRAIQRVLSLLSLDASIEVQLLVLSLCQAYIQRFPALHLTLISDLVTAMINLIQRHEHVKDDAIVVQARHIITLGLRRGAQNGMFLNLAKIPQEEHFFVILRDILLEDAKTGLSGEPLRDALLRDTTRRMLERDHDGGTSQVILRNLQQYVNTVHHEGYDADLLRSVGSCMVGMMRRTAEWGANFDLDPILDMLCLLVQHNRNHGQDLLVHLDAILQAALPKLYIDPAHLRRVLQVTTGLSPQVASRSNPGAGQDTNHYIVNTVMDMLFDGLRNVKPIPPASITSMLQACLDLIARRTEYGFRVIESGLVYIQSFGLLDQRLRPDLKSSMVISECVMGEAIKRPDAFSAFLQAADNSNLGIRWWNLLLLQALTGNSDDVEDLLFDHFMKFALAYGAVLRPAARIPDPAASDINHAYISIKQWLLLAQRPRRRSRATPGDDVESAHTRTLLVWNELWPAFERLSRAEDPSGRSLPIALMMTASIGDLFLFLRQSRSPLLTELSSKMAWFQGSQNANSAQVSTKTKLARALLANASEALAAPLSLFISQISSDITVADKLFAAEALVRETARQP